MKSSQSLTRWSGLLLFVLLTACEANPARPPSKIDPAITWPSGVVRHPLYVLDSPSTYAERDRDADDSATILASKEAAGILERDKAEIVMDSLFADSRVLSEQPIAWLLVANRIPFIETNINDARWIFFQAKRPGAEALKARGKRFVRFKLARDGDRDCFRGNDEGPYVNFAVSVPKTRGECMVIEFTDELISKYRLGIDLTNKANRVAYYELSEMGSNKSILRIPFWNLVGRGILLLPGDYYTTTVWALRGFGMIPKGDGTYPTSLGRFFGSYYQNPAGAIGHVLSRIRGPAYPN